MNKSAVSLLVSLCSAVACAATLTYTPSGSAPYYWSTEANWSSETLPTANDHVTISQAALKTSPLTVQAGESAAVASNVFLDVGTLYVEPGATLTANKGGGGFSLAQTASGTAVITNYGTITAYNLDLGTYSQSRGLLAQFDNFGTLTLANALRLQVKGTPSLFYNHAGATVRKTGGNQYTFYFGVDGNSANRACKIINEGDFFDNTTEIWMGLTSRTYSENEIIVQGNGRFFADKKVAVGFMTDSIATITLNDNGYLSGKATWHLGGSDVDSRAFPRAEGHIILNDNSFFMASNSVYVGRRADCIGLIALNDSSKMITARNVPVQFGFAANSVGTLTLTNSAVADFGYYVYVGSGTAARGFVSLAGDSRMYVTNNTLIVGYNNGATGVLSVAENAQLHAPILGIGQTSVAGTTGFVKLSGTATLFSTNISLPKWGGAGHGTLEVADNSVITNLLMMQVGQNAAKTSALVAMRGGSIFFDIDPESPEYMKDGYFNPLYLNPHLSAVKGLIRGWGKIAFSEPRTYVTEATIPSGITHYGQIIADGEGELRDLDFSRFGALNYANTRANASDTNGWFAVNKGRLKLPRSLPRKTADYRCVGDYWSLDYSGDAPADAGLRSRLCNTFTCTFSGAALSNFIFAELYATDRDDIPAGLDGVGSQKIVSVWRIGLFDDGPEADDPTHPSAFTSARIHFKYPNVGDDLDDMAAVCVYRHDGTADGKWRLVGRAAPSTSWPVVPAEVAAPSAANWNMGWFAITGRTKPFGSTLSIR